MFQEKFYEQSPKIINIFDEYFEKQGFSVHYKNSSGQGYGAYAIHEDKFVPIFNLCMWSYPLSYSIHVEDRNGNIVVGGNTAAIYSLDVDEVMEEQEVINKFKKLVKDVYDKYGKYCRENRLDFVYNNLKMERKEYANLNDDLDIEKQEEI